MGPHTLARYDITAPQWKRIPTQLVPPKARSVPLCQVLSLVGFTSLPAHKLFKQGSHIHLQEAEVNSPTCYYKTYIPQPLLVHSTPECNPHVAFHGM